MRYRNCFYLVFAVLFTLFPVMTDPILAAPLNVDEYKSFSREVEQIILKMKEVAAGAREQSDLRTLEFLLREYNQAVAARNWRKADIIRKRMRVSLIRGGAVASDADRRKADSARADTERRHREVMRQRERQHRESIRQKERQHRELIDQLRGNQASPR